MDLIAKILVKISNLKKISQNLQNNFRNILWCLFYYHNFGSKRANHFAKLVGVLADYRTCFQNNFLTEISNFNLFSQNRFFFRKILIFC